MDKLAQHRFFIKDTLRKRIDFRKTDQNQGVPAPPLQKPFDRDLPRVALSEPNEWETTINPVDLIAAIANRKSHRAFTADSLTLDELSYLLWTTQAIRPSLAKNPSLRTVPSAGARHSFETYLFVMRVDGLKPGLYRFLPLDNQLLFLTEIEEMQSKLARACFGQRFVSKGAVTFAWATIPYRMEWRYSLCAHRVILMDAGHLCQNLYLACEAISAGTCAIGAYDQERMDKLLGVDGEDEFTVYLAPVGKVPSKPT